VNASLASIDEAARQRYELAWHEGRPESIEQFLPSHDHPLFQATVEELVMIEIEMSWKVWKQTGILANAPRPDLIETFLTRFPTLQQSKIVHRLIEQECRSRLQANDSPTAEEYRQRFPDLTLKNSVFVQPINVPSGRYEEPKPTWQSGKQFGRYRLDKEFSRGSFGIVWQAQDTSLGRTVALKQLKEFLATKPEYRQRFLAEAKITAQLQHPGIVPIHEMGGEDEFPFYTMNLVGGETLAEAIDKYHRGQATAGERALQWQKLITAYLAIARTMAFAHSKGFIHRDLKPANIILGQFGETLILDWGLAKQLHSAEASVTSAESNGPLGSDVTQQGSIVGTPAYMSPEQAAGKTDSFTPRSDVFALGIILYELLTGQRPYHGDTQGILLQLSLGADFPRPSAIRRGTAKSLEAICLKAMAHAPEARYADAEELRADVERHLADEPVQAFPEPWQYRVARWIRRHRTVSTTIAVTTLLALIGSIIGYFLYTEAEASRLKDAQDRLQQLITSTKTDEQAAQVELQASRFSSAVALLDRAAQATRREPTLAETATRLAARSSRLQRVAEFARLADQAEMHAAMDRDEASVTMAERALKLMFVLDHLPDWWDHLPTQDLDPEQTDQLREDTSRLLLMLGLQRVKIGVLTILGGDKYYRSALELLPAIQNYHVKRWGGASLSGRILENYCHSKLQHRDKIHPIVAALPHGPTDHFYLGMCYFWLGSIPTSFKIENVLPANLASDLRSIGGIDLSTPLDTSLSMFRMATTLEPKRYWTYNWLGWCQMIRGDHEGAAQAFSAAVALRTGHAFSYSERARVLMQPLYRVQYVLQPQKVLAGLSLRTFPFMGTLPVMMSDIAFTNRWLMLHLQQRRPQLERIMLGLELGLKYDNHAVDLRLQLARCQFWLGEYETSLASFATGLDDTALRVLLTGETYDTKLQYGNITDLTRSWQQHTSKQEAARWAILAHARWVTGQSPTEALNEALRLDPAEPRALLIRGLQAMRQKQLDAAKRDLEVVVKTQPDNFLARAGLARLEELAGHNEVALVSYQRLAKLAATDWQQVEAGLGEVRLLAALKRPDEARVVVERIYDYHPSAVAASAKRVLK
jgi:serine/threonine protein kinase